MGLPLYMKHGWSKVGEVVIDLREHGGDGVVTEVCLVREPRTRC